jgi:DNA-binding transcriptional LysR family regulator
LLDCKAWRVPDRSRTVRPTRSVAPTESGEQLIARRRPALADVESVLDRSSGCAIN